MVKMPRLVKPARRTESEMVEYISGSGKFASFGAYSPLARASAPRELIAIAGQLGADSGGHLTGNGDTSAQVRQVFQNVGTALAEAGLGFSDVLKFTTYVVGRDTIPDFMATRKEVFADIYPDGQYPPNTLLLVPGLVEERFVVEVEALAARS
jgi:enamine deaminase RidA (YjgF/YER057c/UK114 family)